MDTQAKLDLFNSHSLPLSYWLVGRGWPVRGTWIMETGKVGYSFDLGVERDLKDYSIARSVFYAHADEMKRRGELVA